jgi:hypothetical protein
MRAVQLLDVGVVISSPTIRVRAKPQEGPDSVRGDFYGIAVKAGLKGARLNWLDQNGRPGSPGFRLPDAMMRRR